MARRLFERLQKSYDGFCLVTAHFLFAHFGLGVFVTSELFNGFFGIADPSRKVFFIPGPTAIFQGFTIFFEIATARLFANDTKQVWSQFVFPTLLKKYDMPYT